MSKFWKCFFVVSSCFILSALVFSCASTKVERGAGDDKSIYGEKTSIVIPITPVRRGYFYPIDSSIITDVELGTPESLRRAAGAVRSAGRNNDENGKVLLNVAAAIMEFAWKGERVNWDVPPIENDTPYAGAIHSARQGVFDTSTGNVDFLATLLPSLVVASSVSVDEFFTEAEQTLLACLNARPRSVIARYLLGILYQKHGDYKTALTHIEAAENNDRSNRTILYAHAICLEHIGDYGGASSIASELFLRNANDIDALKLSVRIAAKQGDWNAADEYVARVLMQEPNDREYLLFRTRILMEKGDYIRAASLLDVYARQDSTSKEYLLQRARLQYTWSRNTSAAISTIENALSLYPNDADVLIFAAELSAATGSSIGGYSAQTLAQNVLANDSDNILAREYAVRGLVQNASWQEAYTQSSRLMAAAPENRQYAILHITICLALKRNDEAWNIVSALYRDNSTDGEVLRAYITVLAETGRTQTALTLINENISTTDADFRSFLFYRRSFLRGNQEDALSDLRTSLIANPRNNDALFRLYQIYFNAKEYRRAQYYLRQVVALNPDNSYYRRLNEELNRLVN